VLRASTPERPSSEEDKGEALACVSLSGMSAVPIEEGQLFPDVHDVLELIGEVI